MDGVVEMNKDVLISFKIHIAERDLIAECAKRLNVSFEVLAKVIMEDWAEERAWIGLPPQKRVEENVR